VWGLSKVPGGFDSHTFPPGCASGAWRARGYGPRLEAHRLREGQAALPYTGYRMAALRNMAGGRRNAEVR